MLVPTTQRAGTQRPVPVYRGPPSTCSQLASHENLVLKWCKLKFHLLPFLLEQSEVAFHVNLDPQI